MIKKKKKKIKPDSIIDLLPDEGEEDERDLSWMIDGVRSLHNTNKTKRKKDETDK